MKRVALALMVSIFCWFSTAAFAEEETAAAGGASSGNQEKGAAGTDPVIVGNTANTGTTVGEEGSFGGYGPEILGTVMVGAIIGGVVAASGGSGGGGTITTTTHH